MLRDRRHVRICKRYDLGNRRRTSSRAKPWVSASILTSIVASLPMSSFLATSVVFAVPRKGSFFALLTAKSLDGRGID